MEKLFFEKEAALYDSLNQRANAELLRCRCVENFLNRRPVSETSGCSGCVENELLREVACDLAFVAQQETLELTHVSERSAIRQFAAAVDRQCAVKRKFLPVFADPDFMRRGFIDRAITITMATEHIKTLQRKTSWIHLGMTRSACGLVAVSSELIPNRG